ncbi:hypothetical protein SAMN05443144_1169 [Fodinibius roseus]|uniref:Uncharacterized protein n=1 Tax=Fodinibius roseus TaxID=1194090 RepID=A0A1M5FX58_9BACT|nr:hypothetical protein SAMN05443144_1169 [Fodinibius roseus]
MSTQIRKITPRSKKSFLIFIRLLLISVPLSAIAYYYNFIQIQRTVFGHYWWAWIVVFPIFLSISLWFLEINRWNYRFTAWVLGRTVTVKEANEK